MAKHKPWRGSQGLFGLQAAPVGLLHAGPGTR
jgi:hypothetical protein